MQPAKLHGMPRSFESLIGGHESRMLTAHPRAGFIADRKDRSERSNNLESRERRKLNSREIDSFHSSSLALFLTAGCLAETRICRGSGSQRTSACCQPDSPLETA